MEGARPPYNSNAFDEPQTATSRAGGPRCGCRPNGVVGPEVGVNLWAVSHLNLTSDLLAWLKEKCGAVELGVFEANQVRKQKTVYRHLLAAGKRGSIHGPVEEVESVVDRFVDEYGIRGGVTEEVRIVGHANVVAQHPKTWREFGSALLIENLGEARDPGGVLLREAFEVCPEAELCLDVAHELNTRSSPEEAVEYMLELAATYPVGEVHLGCVNEAPPGRRHTTYENVEGVALRCARSFAQGHQAPIILEGGNLEDKKPIVWSEAERILAAVKACCDQGAASGS